MALATLPPDTQATPRASLDSGTGEPEGYVSLMIWRHWVLSNTACSGWFSLGGSMLISSSAN